MSSHDPELEALLAPTEGSASAAGQYTQVKANYTHDAMVDLIIAQPWISQNNLAAHFGYSASWVSQIIASDAFQARLAERTRDIVDPALRTNVENQFKGLVLRSMEILSEKLNRPAPVIPDNLALRTLELSSRALGYGARIEQTNVQVNLDAHLEDLGGRLTKLLERKRGEVLESPGGPPLEGT